MRNNGFFRRNVVAVVAVALLSIGVGASAMGGIESCADAIGGTESHPRSGNNGSIAYKRVYVDKFDKIEVSGLVAVEFTQGKFPGYVELEATPEFMDNFDVTVKDRKLKLGCHLSNGNGSVKFMAKVTAPDLKEVEMDAVSTLNVDSPLSVDDFLLETSGVNSVNLGEVNGKKMTIKAHGVTTINLHSAKLKGLYIISDGVSDMRLKGLNVDKIDASVQSVSNIMLSGRCRSIIKQEDLPGKIDTKGLIVEASPSSQPSQSGSMTMPRIP